MVREITIDPVTRIEGHARITIQLDEAGKVADTLFHVTQFRGFEKLIEGRPLSEMPSIMARICGICPVSHLMASAKACDDLLAVEIPATAVKLRKIMNFAQIIQSHALNFFHLSSPDLLLGMDADPAERNIFGVIRKFPDRAKDGVMLRKFGQQIIEWLGGKRVHPAWVVPGGVTEPLSPERREQILGNVTEGMAIARRTIDWYKGIVDNYTEEIASFANFPSLHLGLTTPEGNLEHYDGPMTFVDEQARNIATVTNPRHYASYIDEAVEDFTYLKFPFYKPMGYPNGLYRVGPLSRLCVAERCGTPLADMELREFRQRLGRVPSSSFHYHWARLIEIIYCIEMIRTILDEADILDTFVRARARPNRFEGVGISEAPRGLLLHHYKIDEHGQMRWANMIIASGHNNLAMNRGIKQVAERFVDGDHLQEGMLNRVEAVIRAFDPCLSCSTHAIGQMAMVIELRQSDGTLVDKLTGPRDGDAR
ncbi:NAD-reducing hydrogenase HoxS subunit beta [Planctomycetes bacterium Pan216]|uniref:NAD-reducing hydrogenase HoxS subunit beta n=1 Tax=Kolteria novifilia TaxID=2527975 RepID=A0A518AYD5_9BACT|nr:NAD-reducing hydrogenase HoxS subunit beta [Planctomycetes bacterium Pan216]